MNQTTQPQTQKKSGRANDYAAPFLALQISSKYSWCRSIKLSPTLCDGSLVSPLRIDRTLGCDKPIRAPMLD